MNPTNALTIDVEDYFQVHALSKSIRYKDWDQYPSTIEKNTHKILELLDAWGAGNRDQGSGPLSPCALRHAPCDTKPRATFFILGWIAQRYPNLVKEIHRRGHEIASHGYRHQVIYDQTPREFKEDIKKSKQILEDITGEEVIGYRAPTYSITKKTMWALNILAEEGYKYDSSIFPIHHDYYGMPTAPRFPFIWNLNSDKPKIVQNPQSLPAIALATPGIARLSRGGRAQARQAGEIRNPKSEALYEFPISTARLFGRNIPCSGGGYFRLFPYPITRVGLKRINREGKPFIFYLHPWELDPNIPKVKNLSCLSKFRTYTNLSKTKAKLKKLLTDFKFTTIKSLFSNLTC